MFKAFALVLGCFFTVLVVFYGKRLNKPIFFSFKENSPEKTMNEVLVKKYTKYYQLSLFGMIGSAIIYHVLNEFFN